MDRFRNLPEEEEQRDDVEDLFIEFVERVLALQGNSPINKCSISCICVGSVRVDAWIRNVLEPGVEELGLLIVLDLQTVGKKKGWSPTCFEGKKFVKLEISYALDIDWFDGRIFLPMLRTLILKFVDLSIDKFGSLLHGFPALEELVMGHITWSSRDAAVSDASLKRLTITSNHIAYHYFYLGTFSVDTPSLVRFCYSDYDAIDYPVVKMKSLVRLGLAFW
ncbi:PREDICTED: F-box protein At3g59000 isoform X2 [Camelina sativa]|uniref:F-box protein At3g59000 isoform X2 n=1 Tax=Camelina sativa TaxID=90675 RepID=A0ABM0U4M1_CAMSA|nr:PREDICTED: F-box protein At3g59000 isoform X2 [Camelina sativa]